MPMRPGRHQPVERRVAECLPMTDSLRDQLLGLGFKPAPKPDKPPQRDGGKPGKAQRPMHAHAGKSHADKSQARKPEQGRPQANRPPQRGKPRTQEDIDLVKAYAIRAQREKDERIEAERLKQEEARKRREAKAKLAGLLKDKALNDANAELARHFDYGGKIKRIYVNAGQLKSLNAGE